MSLLSNSLFLAPPFSLYLLLDDDSALIVFNQLLLWTLTFWKYRWVHRIQTPRFSELSISIVDTVMRDNSLVFFVLSGKQLLSTYHLC